MDRKNEKRRIKTKSIRVFGSGISDAPRKPWTGRQNISNESPVAEEPSEACIQDSSLDGNVMSSTTENLDQGNQASSGILDEVTTGNHIH